MKRKPISGNTLNLLALIALREGEISEEACCDITGFSRETVRDEMNRRTGKFSPLRETMDELDTAKRKLDEAVRAIWRLHESLARYIDEFGLYHDQDDCPEDVDCECPILTGINEGMGQCNSAMLHNPELVAQLEAAEKAKHENTEEQKAD